jgi:hypothetical protein
MIRLFKKNIESSVYTLTKNRLNSSSNLSRDLLDPIHSKLIINRFQRRYLGAPKHIPIDKEYSTEIQAYWRKLLGITITPAWHHIIRSINGKKDPRYVPQDIWAEYFHKKLNPPKYHDPLIADKNALDLYITKDHLPKTVFKIINGDFFDATNRKISLERAKEYLFQDDHDKFFKPSRLFQGQGAIKLKFDGNLILCGGQKISFEDFIQKVDRDSIVQYAVEQHPKIASVHPHSLNTIRIFTIRVGTEIHYLNGSIKFGVDHHSADNNGFLCGINKDHTIKKVVYNRKLQKFTEHMNSKIVFQEFGKIPHYDEAIELCKNVHETLLFHDFAAWDIAIKKDGTPIIIELNSKPGILASQIRFESPLFGDLTEEVWKYVSKK